MLLKTSKEKIFTYSLICVLCFCLSVFVLFSAFGAILYFWCFLCFLVRVISVFVLLPECLCAFQCFWCFSVLLVLFRAFSAFDAFLCFWCFQCVQNLFVKKNKKFKTALITSFILLVYLLFRVSNSEVVFLLIDFFSSLQLRKVILIYYLELVTRKL